MGGLLLGWLVFAATMDRVFARRIPELALFWNPASADANAALGDRLIQNDTAGTRERITQLAARSLRRQPVNPIAPRLLGLEAAQHGDTRKASRLIRYAETMSRRDLSTQVALIEDHVSRSDVAGALLHYDRALKSSNTGRALLIPILARAADDPAIWRPLTSILVTRPQWGRQFLVTYVPIGTDANALYTMAHALGMDRVPSSDPWLLQGIEKRLVDLSAYGQAIALYNRAHGLPADDRTPLRNAGFEQPGNWGDPFDWNLVDEQDLAATRQPSPVAGSGFALFLTATNGRGGDLASQFTLLAPGQHSITAVVGDVQGDPLAHPRLVVRCAKGRDLLQLPFPPAPANGRVWRIALTVPADCPAQQIILRGTSSLDPGSAVPWIDNIAIRREGR